MVRYDGSCVEIKKEFDDRGITSDKPGFYNDANFVVAERQNPDFLNYYARAVQCLKFDSEYLRKAKDTIEKVAKIIFDETKTDGRMGACIDASIALAQILEAEGIWNYQVTGTLAIRYPEQARLVADFFFSRVAPDELQAKAGHSWLVAPPFEIVDLSLSLQEYSPREKYSFLPEYLLVEKTREAEPRMREICSPKWITQNPWKVTEAGFLKNIDLARFWSVFRPSAIFTELGASLKYIPMGITASEGTLEENTAFRANGKTAVEIYADIVKPALAETS